MIGIISAIVISILPFLYLFTQIKIVGNFNYAFANIAGFIGAAFLLWEFILGIKVLTKKIAPNPALFIKLHILLGVWGMFFVLIHPILDREICNSFSPVVMAYEYFFTSKCFV
ncbi:MAG: hypothetical protein NTV98_04380 [Candidatus Roizmanbacteria bacterium]|nr:hypothetical protein [Candidatus Roizmanbacteria bacterium]